MIAADLFLMTTVLNLLPLFPLSIIPITQGFFYTILAFLFLENFVFTKLLSSISTTIPNPPNLG